MIYGARVCLCLTDGLVADGCYAMLHRGECFVKKGRGYVHLYQKTREGFFMLQIKRNAKLTIGKQFIFGVNNFLFFF